MLESETKRQSTSSLQYCKLLSDRPSLCYHHIPSQQDSGLVTVLKIFFLSHSMGGLHCTFIILICFMTICFKIFNCFTVLSNSLVKVGFSYKRVNLGSLLTDPLFPLQRLMNMRMKIKLQGLKTHFFFLPFYPRILHWLVDFQKEKENNVCVQANNQGKCGLLEN